MTKRIAPVVSALVIAAMALTGCAGNAETAPVSSPSDESSSAPATAEPEVDPADPTSWHIGEGSVGPLSIGGSLSGNLPHLVRYEPPERCDANPTMRIFKAAEHPTLWVAVDGQSQDLIKSISVGGDAPGGVVRGSPKTLAGIGVGSAEPKLLQTYPSATAGHDFGVDHYSVNDSEGSWLVFGMFDGAIQKIDVGDTPSFKYEFCG